MKKVMIFGTFDGLHEGHLDFFRQARGYGDYLIAVVARDVNVKKIKSRPSVKNENERLEILKNCNLVNETALGYENGHYKIIKDLKPDVICLGYDQNSYNIGLEEKLIEMGMDNIKIYILKPYKPEKFKSSIINKK